MILTARSDFLPGVVRPFRHPGDLGAERVEPLVDALVAALDLVDVVDDAGALRRRARQSPSPCRRGCRATPSARPQRLGPATIARCGSHSTIRAPMRSACRQRTAATRTSSRESGPCLRTGSRRRWRSTSHRPGMPATAVLELGTWPPRSCRTRRSWPRDHNRPRPAGREMPSRSKPSRCCAMLVPGPTPSIVIDRSSPRRAR